MPKIEYYIYFYARGCGKMYTKTSNYDEAIMLFNDFKNLGFDKIELVKRATGEKPKTLESYVKEQDQ